MVESLTKHGLFIDYLYRLRVLDPSVKSESSELNEKCTDYTESRLVFLSFQMTTAVFFWSAFLI